MRALKDRLDQLAFAIVQHQLRAQQVRPAPLAAAKIRAVAAPAFGVVNRAARARRPPGRPDRAAAPESSPRRRAPAPTWRRAQQRHDASNALRPSTRDSRTHRTFATSTCDSRTHLMSTTPRPAVQSGSRATARRPPPSALRRSTRAHPRARCSSRSRSPPAAAR